MTGFTSFTTATAGSLSSSFTMRRPGFIRVAGRKTNSDATTAAPVNLHDAIGLGLAEAIMQAPTRVQRWLLAPPRDPPPWRYRETAAEREAREQCESDGAWCG